jgi:hypothetical protein
MTEGVLRDGIGALLCVLAILHENVNLARAIWPTVYCGSVDTGPGQPKCEFADRTFRNICITVGRRIVYAMEGR